MVHALNQTHSLLRSGGGLVNVHDLPAPHVIEIHGREVIQKVGWLMDKNDFENERAALNALAQVVSDHRFNLEDEQDFIYNISIDELNEFYEWLAEWWSSAFLPDGISQRLAELIEHADPPTKIVLKVPARMTKLRAV